MPRIPRLRRGEEDVPPEARADLVEGSEEGRRRLAELKDRIRASTHPTRDYRDRRTAEKKNDKDNKKFKIRF